ncbi:hypothetical protein [Mucilaginibacter sp. OK283]|jgi:hypothetical protein|uniref:hypothetical protein n=1 Tax=Mucilaginibacter sp. OK283 TaxID=1881049 RepID=UPI0008CB5FF0|nr:hypothetical protein [Mucilaginibacter sp. OK283]SEP41563.1 hypothetical protein SAMN05428947_115103 [Mucilaginibacter sp. OK283]
MKSKLLKSLFLNRLNADLTHPQNQVTILNAEVIDMLYGGVRSFNECATHSGSCSELTACGTYNSCSDKCVINSQAA